MKSARLSSPTKKHRICILASNAPRFKGDYSSPWLLELGSNFLNDYGESVSLVVPHYPGAKNFEVIDGVQIFRFRYMLESLELLGYGRYFPHEINGGKNKMKALWLFGRNAILMLFLLLSMFLHTITICRKENVDVLLPQWIFPCGFVGMIAGKVLKINCVPTAYGTDLIYLKRFKLAWLGRWLLDSFPHIIAISEYTREIAFSLGIKNRQKIKVIPEGVCTPNFVNTEDLARLKNRFGVTNEKIVFSVHRLIPLKGTEYLIRAASIVADKCPNVRFIIGGEGPMKDELETLIRQLKLADKVILTGFIPSKELPLYYSICDIYIMSSIIDEKGNTEGLGLPAIEAMSYGKPVIGFDVGGPKYTIRNGYNGFSIEEKNWRIMGERIMELITNENLREFLGNNGKQFFYDNYTWDNVTNEYTKILNLV